MLSPRATYVMRAPASGATTTDTTAPAAPRSAADTAPSLPLTASGSRIRPARGGLPDQHDADADPPDHPQHRGVVVQPDAGSGHADQQRQPDDDPADAGPAGGEAVAEGGHAEGDR